MAVARDELGDDLQVDGDALGDDGRGVALLLQQVAGVADDRDPGDDFGHLFSCGRLLIHMRASSPLSRLLELDVAIRYCAGENLRAMVGK